MLVMVMSFIISSVTNAQEKTSNSKLAEITIKVSSQCSMCKENIERTLAFEKGVTKSSVDLEKNTVLVSYKPSKTTPEAIKKAITLAGYDADEMPADAKAYSKLSDCCKKPEDREHDHAGHDH